MSVNQYINGKLNLIAGGYGSGGGECGCEENTFTGTKEEVQAAIAAGEIKDDFIIFVTDDFEETSGSKIEYITQEQYDALPESKLTDNVEYRITDKGIDSVSASNVTYDGSASGLDAMNVQGAVDELKDSLTAITIGELEFTSNYTVSSGMTNTCIKTGNVKNIRLGGSVTCDTANTYVIIATLPSGFEPTNGQLINCIRPYVNDQDIYFRIAGNTVQVNIPTAGTVRLVINETYI